MKDKNINQKKIANDIHLKNIFIGETYLELGIIDVDVVQRLLKYEQININEITYFPVQNKGLGHSNHHDVFLRDYLPFFFFQKLAKNNTSYQLVISYGLLKYTNIDGKETFMPILLLPINMYYENGDLFVQMISSPVENPMIYSIFTNFSKITPIQNLDFHDIHSIDYLLYTLSKLTNNGVRLDNYLTYAVQRERDIILNTKNFISLRTNYELAVDKIYQVNKKMFMFPILNKEQRVFLERSINKENLTLIGINGTGKTTVLKNIIVNNMAKGLKTLYISNSNESIKDVYDFLSNHKLDRYAVDLTVSFDKLSSLYYEDLYLEGVNSSEDLIKQVNEYYTLLENYETNMNKSIYDFKFMDIIEQYTLINSDSFINDISSIKDSFDDLSSIYKHEYEDIYQVLKKLEINTQKIKSFRNSVWNAIPIVNNIKHVNQVLNVVYQLNKGLKKLREYEILLGNYGIKSILSFSEMKKCIAPMDKITSSIIPDEWQISIEKFNQAKDLYQQLRKDIFRFQEAEYYLSTRYKNLSKINIIDEIQLLYGNFYHENDLEVITTLLVNEKEVTRIIHESKNNLNNFYTFSTEISQLLNWDFMEKDSYINEIIQLGKLFNDNYINGKMLTIVLNNKMEQQTSELNYLYKQIVLLEDELQKLRNQNSKLNSIDFSKGNVEYENEDYRTYDTKFKKIRKLTKEYLDICGAPANQHDNNIKSLEALKEYYEVIKQKKYRKVFVDFIQSLDDNGYIEILTLFNITTSSYESIKNEMEYFEEYNVKFKESNIKNTINRFNDYLVYLDVLYASNKRLMNVVLNNDLHYVDPKEYYQIQHMLEDFNMIISDLKANTTYKDLFGYLYTNEETNVINIMNIIQMYDAYICVFINQEKVYDSFKNFNDLRIIIDNIVSLISDIGENLRLYSLIFKDSVSRYYFSNIENNVEYLSKLLNAKDELVLYLNITQGIGVLDEYKLNKTIKYIEENDDITNISEKFSYVYFQGLIEKFLHDNDIANTKEYLELLKKTITLENVICKQNSTKFINRIIANNPIDNRKKKIKHYDYKEFFRQNKRRIMVYLCDKNFAIMYSKMMYFDVIIFDDAQTINSGIHSNLFKGKQIIVCGDYQSNNLANQNLVALANGLDVTTLKARYELGPKKLTNNIYSKWTPYINKYDDNLGIKVIEKGLDNYIYNLYMDDYNVKINYFIKNINYQREVYEQIARSFYKKNVSSEDILNFLNNNLFINDLNNRNYIKSDYNILYLKDYCMENSQIVANNLFELLMLAKKELIIFDNENSLLKNINHEFLKMIKTLVIKEDIFTGYELDRLTKKLSCLLENEGYKVHFPGNGINFIVQKPNSNELVTIVILYSNGQVYEMVNLYRELYSQYITNGHKVIFKVMPDLLVGVEQFVKDLIEDING